MIRKPVGEWQRESAVVTATRELAVSGAAVAKAGSLMIPGVLLTGFAALWAIAAVVSGVFGNLPTLIGAGLLSLIAGLGGWNMMRKARRIEPVLPASVVGAGGRAGPRLVEYGRLRLLKSAWIGVALVVLGMAFSGGLLAVILVPMFGLMAVLMLARAYGDRTAVKWDERGVTVATLTGRRTVPWANVRGVRVRERRIYGFYGLIRIGRTEYLRIEHVGVGPFTQGLQVQARLLELGERTLYGLVAELEAAWLGATRPGEVRTVDAPLPVSEAPRPMRVEPIGTDGAFDADAIIARYLAEKVEVEAQARAESAALPMPAGPLARRPAFGRKGL